jgi:hypothetical protein
MADPPRRFPAPSRADKIPGGYVVRGANGQALAYFYPATTMKPRRPRCSRRMRRNGSPSTSRVCRSCWVRPNASNRLCGTIDTGLSGLVARGAAVPPYADWPISDIIGSTGARSLPLLTISVTDIS